MTAARSFIALALVAGTSLAQGADPLKSPGCIQALEALQDQEAAMLAAARRQGAGEPAAPPASLGTLRARAEHECLGSRADAPIPVGRSPQSPVALAPVRPPSAAALPVPAAVPPPVPLPPLRTLTTCDPSGCWASDGSRLNRMGPLLVGPLGVCTAQSGVLSCR